MRRKVLSALIGVLSLFLGTFTFLEPSEIGLSRNWVTGELRVLGPGGIYITPPWVFIAHIDTRPQRVCITSSAHAILNCKLVQFEPSAFQEFVKVEGFRLYWWSNRFSLNLGYREEYRGMRDVLRGYAFGARKQPFITVLDEFQER